jgi:alkylated DNA repair dioxygenase AlkB
MNVQLLPLGLNIDFADIRAVIDWAQRSVTVYGKTYPQPRLTRWYGDVAYVYSGLSWEPAPMPPLLQAIKTRVEALTFETFNSVLCNLYRDGNDSVGWHADDEPIFGGDPIVASVSFGAPRVFKLRPNKGKSKDAKSFLLEDGTLFVMGKGIQPAWKHCIPPTDTPVGERVNLTFRQTIL